MINKIIEKYVERKICHAIHFGFPFNTVQFICKEIRYQKIWVTRKQLKINPMPVFPSQLTGTEI